MIFLGKIAMHRKLVKEKKVVGSIEERGEKRAQEQVYVIYSALINHVKFPRRPPPY